MKYSELKTGMKLIAGHGFDCIPQGAVVEVHAYGPQLIVECGCGLHFLDGQIDAHGNLVGLGLAELENSTAFAP